MTWQAGLTLHKLQKIIIAMERVHMNKSDKIVVVHQPDFMPYLGFFDRLLHADIYVVFDNVQFVASSRGWTNRDKIKVPGGWKWITVGTKKAPRDSRINEIQIFEDNEWRKRHLNLYYENYRHADYYDEIMPYIEELYDYKCTRMMDFNLESIYMLNKLLDIDVDYVVASELNPEGKNNRLIIDIMNKLGTRNYLSGIGARDYFEQSLYDEAGIHVIWQDWTPPVYKQQFDGFIPYLSSIDLLFNCGIGQARKIIRKTI